MQAGGQGPSSGRSARIRRRDRHGRGIRGVLAPVGVPLHRTRAQRFDDLVLDAVTRLEPRWEKQLAGIEFAVEEIPPPPPDDAAGPAVPLSRLEPGSPTVPAGGAERDGGGEEAHPPRIVVYRRPLMARADGEDELGDLVFEVVVEEFARLLGMEPEDIDPDYGGDE